jgi:hypothetical protein
MGACGTQGHIQDVRCRVLPQVKCSMLRLRQRQLALICALQQRLRDGLLQLWTQTELLEVRHRGTQPLAQPPRPAARQSDPQARHTSVPGSRRAH